jgi:hypothetical protein
MNRTTKRPTLSDEVRAAVASCGKSRYRVCKDIALGEASMSRFMAHRGGLSMRCLDRLAAYLGLGIVVDSDQRKVR